MRASTCSFVSTGRINIPVSEGIKMTPEPKTGERV